MHRTSAPHERSLSPSLISQGCPFSSGWQMAICSAEQSSGFPLEFSGWLQPDLLWHIEFTSFIPLTLPLSHDGGEDKGDGVRIPDGFFS